MRQNAMVPTNAINNPYTPAAIPTAIEVNMKTMFLGFLKVVLNLIIAKAPNIPKPRARLSPIACITVATGIEIKIKD
jgi:hypothetical protein